MGMRAEYRGPIWFGPQVGAIQQRSCRQESQTVLALITHDTPSYLVEVKSERGFDDQDRVVAYALVLPLIGRVANRVCWPKALPHRHLGRCPRLR